MSAHDKFGRFEKVQGDDNNPVRFYIYKDLETGVHYIYTNGTTGTGGLTPLLDENGKVVIAKK